MEIIGKGSIGDKAKQLKNKAEIIGTLGFRQSERIVLAQGFLDSILRNNKYLANPLSEIEPHSDFYNWRKIIALQKKMSECELTNSQSETLSQIIEKFNGKPLAVIFSASGDSRGTGVYDSKFTNGDLTHLKCAILEVIASYFTENAVSFRRDSNCGKDLAVIIEPIIGQWHKTNYKWIEKLFAPAISGFGYTSTARDTEGFVSMVEGIGGGVDYNHRKKITPEVLKKYPGNLHKLVQSQTPYSRGFNPNFGKEQKNLPDGLILSKDIKGFINELNLNILFEKMRQLEKICNCPQYFEWALTFKKGKPEYWITQISDVDVVRDMYDFSKLGNILIEGNEVVGTRKLESKKIVYCKNMGTLSKLREFNLTNKNYILVFSGLLTSDWRRMDFDSRHYSNASVLLEANSFIHIHGTSLAHFGGKTQLTGKLFGCVDHKATNLKEIFGELEQENISIIEGKYISIGSEYQNRIVVIDGE